MYLQQNIPQLSKLFKPRKTVQWWQALQLDLQCKMIAKNSMLILFLMFSSALSLQAQSDSKEKNKRQKQPTSVEKKTKQIVSNKKAIVISGFVVDEESSTLLGATIRVGESRIGTITDMEGWYEVSIPIGLFKEEVKLVAELENFEQAITVVTERSKNINFVLKKSAPLEKKGKRKKKKKKKSS